jgi:hypothetical protein
MALARRKICLFPLRIPTKPCLRRKKRLEWPSYFEALDSTRPDGRRGVACYLFQEGAFPA